ncbi:MAG TPA: TlpA disulfide reductase family protein [Patescibacteria group bacterium]|nr:TlpA disulfide reductase family protein [Patescibacteria group bacterium]
MKRLFALFLLVCTAVPAWAAPHSLSMGAPQPVPAVSFADAWGHRVSLDSFKGKVVVLDFWASWCQPCREEFPALDRLQGQLGARGVVVLAVSVDRRGLPAVDKFYSDLRVAHLDKFLDDTQEMATSMGIRGLPTTLVIDRQGLEVARIEGPAAWDSPEMEAVLESMLKP